MIFKVYQGDELVTFEMDTFAVKVVVSVIDKVDSNLDYSLEVELRACFMTGKTYIIKDTRYITMSTPV